MIMDEPRRQFTELPIFLSLSQTRVDGGGGGVGGEGGIRTHVPVTRQHAFEARPLRPLRYLSVEGNQLKRTFYYTKPRLRSPQRASFGEAGLSRSVSSQLLGPRDKREGAAITHAAG